jgi:hypothetical protein
MRAEMELQKGADIVGLPQVDEALTLRYRLASGKFAQMSGPVLLLRTGVFPTMSSDVLEDNKRKQPLEMSATSLLADNVEFTLPAGYEIEELPEALSLTYPFGAYERSVEVRKGSVVVHRQRRILQPVIDVDQLDAARDFFRAIAEDERSLIIVRRAEGK